MTNSVSGDLPALQATMRASVLSGVGAISVQQRRIPAVADDEVLGHEVAGRIVAAGAEVDAGRIGERVAIEPQRPCRVCWQCKAGRYNPCPDPTAENVMDLGVDAFIDASGATPAVGSGITAVRRGGPVVLVGMGADAIALPIPVIQNRELWITGVFRYTDMITGRFGLDDVEQALNADQNPGSLKTMVVPA